MHIFRAVHGFGKAYGLVSDQLTDCHVMWKELSLQALKYDLAISMILDTSSFSPHECNLPPPPPPPPPFIYVSLLSSWSLYPASISHNGSSNQTAAVHVYIYSVSDRTKVAAGELVNDKQILLCITCTCSLNQPFSNCDTRTTSGTIARCQVVQLKAGIKLNLFTSQGKKVK